MTYREDAERELRRRKRLMDESRRRRRSIDEAASKYFEQMHAAGHIERYPDLENSDFRAWLDLSGTGRDIGNDVGEAVALLAEKCPDCAVSRWGDLDEAEMIIKRRDAADRQAHRALTERMVRDLNLRAS